MKNQWIITSTCFLAFGLCLLACDDPLPSNTSSTTSSSSSGDGGAGGMGGQGGASTCVNNPMTHIEIINACTDAEKIDKTVTLPLLQADGTLPPLP